MAAAALLSTCIALAAAFGGGPAAATALPSPGYWIVSSNGGVYQFGTTNFGSMSGRPLANPVVGGAAIPSGLGYWLVASDGGVFSFGNARFHGSTGGIRLNRPIVGMAATPSGKGYWLVASDGGIFAFGDAGFHGSTGNIRLNRPVVGMAATPSGRGYWLVASDGGIFTFGDAGFHGSTGNVALWHPIRGMAATANGGGYWLVATDGGIFPFGNAPFLGSTGNHPPPSPVVGMIAVAHGFPFPPGGTGYDVSLYDCNRIPASHRSVAIVQVTGGAIYNPPNPCYAAEARWAGVNMSAYIFMDGLPTPPPKESLSGPAGTCNGNVRCESYNFGWYWARHWVAYSHGLGINPNLWWLDVETTRGWNLGSGYYSSNGNVIAGAMAGLRSTGVLAGIYSTAYQWGQITGSSVRFPGIPLWVPGAGNISGGANSATTFCSHPDAMHAPFAGGTTVLIQYGYVHAGYTGPPTPYDQDYACV